jgi:hypothetical protein
MRRVVKGCWSRAVYVPTALVAADRTSLAWQNTGYNQPPHTGFFLGDGMPKAPRPAVFTP